MIVKGEITKGQEVYWARILPPYDEFYVLPVKIHTIEEDYFTGTDTTSSMTFLYTYKNKRIFTNKLECQEYVENCRDEYYQTHTKHHLTVDSSEDEY